MILPTKLCRSFSIYLTLTLILLNGCAKSPGSGGTQDSSHPAVVAAKAPFCKVLYWGAPSVQAVWIYYEDAPGHAAGGSPQKKYLDPNLNSQSWSVPDTGAPASNVRTISLFSDSAGTHLTAKYTLPDPNPADLTTHLVEMQDGQSKPAGYYMDYNGHANAIVITDHTIGGVDAGNFLKLHLDSVLRTLYH